MTRRDFVKTTAAAVLLAGVPLGWRGTAYASDAPETPKVRIGIIALTDCSSIVMAHELGLFKKHGIESTISKEASWAVIRDRLTLGENQATHLLLGIPYAATMGLQGSPVKPMIIPMYLNRNGQAITLNKALLDKGVKTPQQLGHGVGAGEHAAVGKDELHGGHALRVGDVGKARPAGRRAARQDLEGAAVHRPPHDPERAGAAHRALTVVDERRDRRGARGYRPHRLASER